MPRQSADRLITAKAVERAQEFYAEHPDAYAYALTYVERVAGKRNDRHPEDVAALAAALVPCFVRAGREDDRAAIRSAARRAVERAAAAIAADVERDADGERVSPYAIDEDESRAALITYAPDPAAAYRVGALDLIAQSLIRLEDPEQRDALRVAAIGMRRGQRTLTNRSTPRTAQRRIADALDRTKANRAAVLADPYRDREPRAPWAEPADAETPRGDWTSRAPQTLTTTELDAAAAPSAATLAALADTYESAAAERDRLRVQVHLGEVEHADAATLAPIRAAWHGATRRANRAAAGLAHAQTHAARTARRTGAPSQTIGYDPGALSPYARNLGPNRPDATPKEDRPAQVPDWAFTGGTARPQVGACVSTRLLDTGTPGTELRLTITAPDGTVWARTYMDPDDWTDEDTRRLSRTLASAAPVEALSHVERILSRPTHGAPKKPSPRTRSRVGSTGPTVPAYGMTR